MLRTVGNVFRDPRLQRYRRLSQMKARRLQNLQHALPEVTCVDVGASYYPHTSWWLFLDSPSTHWIAVEPNAQNLKYLATWPWQASVEAVTSGLSENGGRQTLYVTNIDSGSSLLRPSIPPAMQQRAGTDTRNYYFPVREVEIETMTLAEVVAGCSSNPKFVKLDTQGSELSILRSLVTSSTDHRVVGVEIECSLLAAPYYEKSPRLWEVSMYMEDHGFELIQLDVFPRSNCVAKISNSPRNLVNECDAVFALRPDVVQTQPVESRASLFGFYVTSCLYAEAVRSLKNDDELSAYLSARGCNVTALRSELQRRSA